MGNFKKNHLPREFIYYERMLFFDKIEIKKSCKQSKSSNKKKEPSETISIPLMQKINWNQKKNWFANEKPNQQIRKKLNLSLKWTFFLGCLNV